MKPLHDSQASAKGSFDNIFMNGQEVFKFAVRAVPSVCCLPPVLSLLQRVRHMHPLVAKIPGDPCF